MGKENTFVERFDENISFTGKPEKTPEGYLKVSAPIARIGIYKYKLKDGSTRRELVTKDTLSDQESITSLQLKPVTNRHPQEMLLDSKTVKRRNVGTVGESIELSGDNLVANFIVTDQDAINSMNNGRLQLSPGYQTELEMTPGVWNGQEYDAVQTKRVYNHLALVDNARGGAELKINMDSEDEIGLAVIEDKEDEKPNTNKNGAVNMKMINIDSASVEVSDEVATYVGALTAKVDSATDEVTDLKKTNGELQTKVDSFDAELKTRTDAAVGARVQLVTLAKQAFNTDSEEDKKLLANMDSMDNTALKTAIILNVQPSAKAKLDEADLPSGYLDSRLDSVKDIIEEKKKAEDEKKKQDALNKGRKPMKKESNTKNDSDENPVATARDNMVRADEDAWKPVEETK